MNVSDLSKLLGAQVAVLFPYIKIVQTLSAQF